MGPEGRLSWEEAVCRLRTAPEHTGLVQACFYDDPLQAAACRYWASTEWQAVQRVLGKSRGRALDIGAGRGIAAYALAQDGWAVTALEPDGSDVVGAGAIRALARSTALPIEVVQTWGEQLPFADASFDLVHCRQVLHHARDLPQLCREIGRVLKPGGRVVATREHVISAAHDLQAFLDAHPLHHLYGGEHAYLLADYIGALQRGGLSLEQVLNPYESDINTYPQTTADIKRRWASRLRWPWPGLIPDLLLSWAGARVKTPGRMFSFVGRKPGVSS